MKQKQRVGFLLSAFLYMGLGVAVYGQTEPSSCLYVLDAELQKICLTPDSLPEPVEGMNELLHRLAVEVSLPTAEGHEIAGTQTMIRFIVDETGAITGKLVLKKQFYDCHIVEQMFAIVESMNWTPGYCDGKPVPTEFILPLRVYVN
ncbi:MAG: energy transducer TonB [Bacteroidia bacterium]